MKCGATILTGILVGLALSAQGRPANDAPQTTEPADAGGEPYGAIWLRNVFDLKPPPPPQTKETNAVDAPPPNVKLTGITTIFGKKMALFSVQPQAERGKPPGKEVSYMIPEGERRDGLEVVEIMPKERKVTIKLDDLVSTITFPTNSSPPTGGPPGARPGFFPPPGLTAPGFTPPGAPGFPRPMRGGGPVPQANNYSNPGYSPSGYGGGYSGNNGVAQGGYVAPAGTTSAAGGSGLSSAFTSAAPSLNAAPVTPVLTAEQQQAAIAITHQALVEAGTPESLGMASILPPVPGVTDTPNANNNSSSEGGPPALPSVPQVPFGTTINGHKVSN